MTPGEHVDVHVIDSLATMQSGVHDKSKAFVPTVFPTELRCYADEVRDEHAVSRTIKRSHGWDVRDGKDE
jgi:hypothetical protein